MAELVGGKFLDALNAFRIKKFHVVAGIAVEEVIGAHAEPEEVNLLVRGIGIVVDVGKGRRCERTVAAEIRELVEVCQTDSKCLIATTRETADGTVVSIVRRAIVLLDVGHQVIDEVLAKDVAAELHLGSTVTSGFSWQEFRRVAVGQHNNHLLGLLVGDEVVEDIVHAAYLVIYLLRVGGAADTVEHGIFLLVAHVELHTHHVVVAGRQVDHGSIRAAETLGVVVYVLHAAMWYVADVVGQ